MNFTDLEQLFHILPILCCWAGLLSITVLIEWLADIIIGTVDKIIFQPDQKVLDTCQ